MTEDQGLHKQFYLASKPDSNNSGTYTTLKKFSALSKIDLEKCKCAHVYLIDCQVSVIECNKRVCKITHTHTYMYAVYVCIYVCCMI